MGPATSCLLGGDHLAAAEPCCCGSGLLSHLMHCLVRGTAGQPASLLRSSCWLAFPGWGRVLPSSAEEAARGPRAH